MGRDWHRRGKFRHYFGAHLHRRLFWWFGASIFVTAVVTSLVSHGIAGHGPVRGVWVLGIAGIMLWLMSGKIARRIARPLYQLVQVAEEIGAGRLNARARLPPRGIGEIAVLATAINDMAARIERQIGDQRELLAGVSHEIRTPLARIRVLLELARGGSIDGRTLGQTIDELEHEVLEIDALVGELLANARLDFAALSLRPLDGADVARRALERAGLSPTILDLELPPGGPDLHLVADPTLMARALANLLDNARKHGGGATRFRVWRDGQTVAFQIDDQGPGFPASGTQPPGQRAEGSLGLGLVLVRRIADAHRGSLLLETRPEGGARARLSIPLGRPDAA